MAHRDEGLDVSIRVVRALNGRERGDTEVRAIFAVAATQLINDREAGEFSNVLSYLENAIDMLDSGEYIARYVRATDNAPTLRRVDD